MNDKLLGFLSRYSKQELIYRYAIACLGKDMSPAFDELGCADSVNNIVRGATGQPIGGGASTYLMQMALQKYAFPKWNWRFVEIAERQAGPGDIIISATGFGGTTFVPNGHVGILGRDGKIMSNTSKTGLWEENYTIASWWQRYKVEGRYPVRFYRVIR